MNKKIIFTVTNDLVYDRRMIRIGESLATEGYDVWLVGRILKNSLPFENALIQHKRFKLLFNKGKFFYLEYNIRLFFWLLFQRFDIVCGIDLDTILPCYLASIVHSALRLKGPKKAIPCVYDAHELFTEVPEVIRRPAIRRLWLAVERFIVPRLSYCYTVSQSIVEEFDRRYHTHFELIRNLPVRSALNAAPRQTNKNIILYQGNLNEGRGLETAIEAMQYVDNVEFWIAGDGDLGSILRGMVSDLQLEKKVKFLGYVKPQDLDAVTHQATIGLHILEGKGLSYQFSLANKFLDYIQAGIPQICTQFIEHQRINDAYQVAVLIEKTDVQLLLNAIHLLIDDVDFYKRMKQNCLKAAEVLNWEMEEKRLKVFYAGIG